MMFGPVVEQGMWRMSNITVWGELYKDLYIEADIKEKRLEWIGRVVRRGQGRTVKKYLRVNQREIEEGEGLD
jgi:hypothetical protein